MTIEVFGDNVTKDDVKHLTPRVGARGIIQKGDQYLMVRFNNDDFYTLPGGGVESDESPEEACVREVNEETGYRCKIIRKGITIIEYFIDSIWINHYFILEIVEESTQRLTKEEQKLGLVPVWKTLEEILDIFSSCESTHKDAEAIHNREFLGLTQSL